MNILDEYSLTRDRPLLRIVLLRHFASCSKERNNQKQKERGDREEHHKTFSLWLRASALK
jgi:hypothetical protein